MYCPPRSLKVSSTFLTESLPLRMGLPAIDLRVWSALASSSLRLDSDCCRFISFLHRSFLSLCSLSFFFLSS